MHPRKLPGSLVISFSSLRQLPPPHSRRVSSEGRSISGLGDRIFRETSVPGKARVCGSGEATGIWSFRRCKPAACILDPTGASMRLCPILGFSNGILERRYSRIMLSPPQNMKPYLGHHARIMRAYSLLRILLCFLRYAGLPGSESSGKVKPYFSRKARLAAQGSAEMPAGLLS